RLRARSQRGLHARRDLVLRDEGVADVERELTEHARLVPGTVLAVLLLLVLDVGLVRQLGQDLLRQYMPLVREVGGVEHRDGEPRPRLVVLPEDLADGGGRVRGVGADDTWGGADAGDSCPRSETCPGGNDRDCTRGD